MDIFLNPNVAYVLLVLGLMLGILAVLTPGTGIIEVGAFFALALAGWGIYNLPINIWALLVLVLGVFPFLIAVRRSGQTVYLIVSILALVIGSLYFFQGEVWWRPVVNPVLAILTSGLSGGFLWFAATKTLEASSVQPTHDLTSLIGEVGEARTGIHEEGSVQVAGELWTARSAQPIPPGTQVKVVGREGFMLVVEADE